MVVQLDSTFSRLPALQCGHMFRLMESESVPFQKDASLSPGLLLSPWLDEEGAWGSCPGLTGGSPMLWTAEPPTSSQTTCLLESKTSLTCLSPVFWNVCYSGSVGMLQLKLFRANSLVQFAFLRDNRQSRQPLILPESPQESRIPGG